MPPKNKAKSSPTNLYQGFQITPATTIINRLDINSITPEQFYNSFILTRTPVILTGLRSHTEFQSLLQWKNTNYLNQHAGTKIVQVEHRTSSKSSFGRDAPREPLQFGQFIDKMTNDNDLYYLTSQTTNYDGYDLPDILAEPLVSLQNDLTLRPKLFGNLIPYQINLWMGQAKEGSTSGLHHDYHDNLYILLSGAKVFTLFTPPAVDLLSMQGKLHKIQPNGLLIYANSMTINQNSIPGIDYFHFTHTLHGHLTKWSEFLNNLPNNRQNNDQNLQQTRLITTLMDNINRIDTLLTSKLPDTTENTQNTTIMTTFDHQKLDLGALPADFHSLLLDRIEYWLDSLIDQRLDLSIQFGFDSDDEDAMAQSDSRREKRRNKKIGSENDNLEGLEKDEANSKDEFGSDDEVDLFNFERDDFDDMDLGVDNSEDGDENGDDDNDYETLLLLRGKQKKRGNHQNGNKGGNKMNIKNQKKNRKDNDTKDKTITTAATSEDKLDDEQVFPHFSKVPAPLLYDHHPKQPPLYDDIVHNLTKVNTNSQFTFTIPESSNLYSSLHQRILLSQQTVIGTNQNLNHIREQNLKIAQNLAQAQKTTVILLPNEALYLPASFFHEVRSFNILPEKSGDEKLEAQNDDSPFGGHLALNYWFFPPSVSRPKLTGNNGQGKKKSNGGGLFGMPTNSTPDTTIQPTFETPYGSSQMYFSWWWSQTYAAKHKLEFRPEIKKEE